MKKFLSYIFTNLMFINLIHTHVYHGQFLQDKYVAELLKFKKNGFFFDIGACDGIYGSNSYFFEKNLGWKGILVEPRKQMCELLKKQRKSTIIEGCIYNTTGQKDFLIMTGPASALSGLYETYNEKHTNTLNTHLNITNGQKQVIKVKTYHFNEICKKFNIKKIDYLSIDTEGSEEQIIKSIDFNKIYIDVISVENNYKDKKIRDYLKTKNYKYLCTLGVDDVFKKIKK